MSPRACETAGPSTAPSVDVTRTSTDMALALVCPGLTDAASSGWEPEARALTSAPATFVLIATAEDAGRTRDAVNGTDMLSACSRRPVADRAAATAAGSVAPCVTTQL